MKSEHERGFTLIEVVVTVGILGVIVSSVAASIFVGLKTTQESNARLTESTGVSFASAYVVPDVASAAAVTVADLTGCATSGTPVVRFDWVDSNGPQIAAYAFRLVGGEQALVRQFCVNGASTGEFAVVRGLSNTAPAVVCSPSCAAAASVTMTLVFASGRSVELSASRRTT